MILLLNKCNHCNIAEHYLISVASSLEVLSVIKN